MAVRKDEKRGKWLAEAYIDSKRIRRWFETKAEASRFFNTLKEQGSPVLKAIRAESEKKKSPLISELVDLWFELHGCTLVQGESYRNQMLAMAKALGNPPAFSLTVEQFAEYRKKRLNGEIVFVKKSAVSISTVNFEHTILKAMFNTLRKLGKFTGENPLNDLPLFKEKEKPPSFLRGDEIVRLFSAIDELGFSDLRKVVEICLATGARWSEAANLTSAQIIPHKVTFTKTKSGKNRTVPISQELYHSLPKKQGALFTVYPYQFDRAIKRAGIQLPKNQSTHILRHTFASHFMMNGGNILVLKDILGHYDIKMTMIYAHFAPSLLDSAITLNPLSKVAI